MFINELEICNICECKHAILKFSSDPEEAPLYIVHSNQICEVITLALQLICGVKYSNYEALHEIRNKIYNGKVKLKFTLLRMTHERNSAEKSPQQEHSSDSDVPCTSQQARQRLERRLKRRTRKEKKKEKTIINACRDFTLNPGLIIYSVDGGPTIECSVIVFQIRFFGCTDVIFPRLTNITHGEYCNGKWLDLLNTEFIDKETDENKLIIEFCRLYAKRKIANNDFLNELTKSVFKARNFLNDSRLSHLINIFNDIRWMFEFMTCSEYTVWFLLPSVFGNLEDISKITVENTNFDLLKTEIQLKQPNAKSINWMQAEKHVQELLLVAAQLAFGYHCQQNVVYLHSLRNLEKHQNFEYLNFSLMQNCSNQEVGIAFGFLRLLTFFPNESSLKFFEKNYFNRIVYVCANLNICCVLEYCGGLIAHPNRGFTIDCFWSQSTNEWKIKNRARLSGQETITISSRDFLQQLERTFG